MKQILLNKNKFALVDDSDFEYLNQWHWYLDKDGYANRISRNNEGKKKQFFMHRIINKTPKGMHTDHINRNKLDNRKINLRACTTSQNARNRSAQRNNTTGYKGVTVNKLLNKFTAQIRINNKLFHIGTYQNKIEAARAYNNAAEKYFGEFARLNLL